MVDSKISPEKEKKQSWAEVAFRTGIAQDWGSQSLAARTHPQVCTAPRWSHQSPALHLVWREDCMGCVCFFQLELLRTHR